MHCKNPLKQIYLNYFIFYISTDLYIAFIFVCNKYYDVSTLRNLEYLYKLNSKMCTILYNFIYYNQFILRF